MRMRFRVSTELWTAKLLAALSLLPLFACENTVTGADCRNGKAIEVAGQKTGFVSCEGDWIQRTDKVTCPSELPRATQCDSGFGGGAPTGGCTTDADCTDKPNGHCDNDNFGGGCFCSYGCTTDADCGAGQICMCGSPVGHCTTASCTSNADCNGALCATYITEPGCGGFAFACQSEDDECTGDGDCPSGQQCTLAGDHRICKTPECVIGRPFLVEGRERVASLAARGDWREEALAPCVHDLDESEREALAQHWTRVGLMEHASVAAFARFVLQLLSVGAPPDLLKEAQVAMADETRHAELAFALASAYANKSVGPGTLALEGALEGCDARSILETTIFEGCVGETVAAIEAAEMAAHASDPVVRSVLLSIESDEARHAELAWRYVRWAITSDPSLFEVAARTFDKALSKASVDDAPASAPRLLEHGVPDEGLQRAIRQRALAGVVAPCARSLLRSATIQPPPAIHA